MKNYLAASAALTVLVFFLIPALLPDLTVQDKQAPGTPGHKTFQLQVGDTWYVVPETVWDRCMTAESLPACAVSEVD